VVETSERQTDLAHAFDASLDAYRGGLFLLGYGYQSSRSNSYGYDFRSHRVRVQAAAALPWQIDGLVLFTRQFRRYPQALSGPRGPVPSVDDYEQGTFVGQISRKAAREVTASLRYAFARNGARRGGDAYSKHLIGLLLEFGAFGPSAGGATATRFPLF
jgi:hypothetical protein